MRKYLSLQIFLLLIFLIPLTVHAEWKIDEIKTRNKPSARFGSAIAYDASRECVVLFGGDQGSRQTWEFDNQNWKAFQIAINPPARMGGSMAYFPEMDKVVLFGGVKMPATPPDYTMLNDIWVYSATGWAEIKCATSPSPRSETAMVYDKKRKCLVLFGGMSNKVKRKETLNDTWEFDGKNWKQVYTRVSPSARSGHAMVYDDKNGVVVMYGGRSGDVQTWEYNGENWKHKYRAPTPGSRTGPALVYDPLNEVTVLVGGVVPSSVKQKEVDDWKQDRMWIYDGTKWKVEKLNRVVPGHICPSVIYNPKRKSIMGFGGLSFSKKGDPQQSDYTWEITNK